VVQWLERSGAEVKVTVPPRIGVPRARRERFVGHALRVGAAMVRERALVPLRTHHEDRTATIAGDRVSYC
jgi:hypothetical protein